MATEDWLDDVTERLIPTSLGLVNVGHLAARENPDAVNAEVEAFLAPVAGRSATAA